MRYTQSQSKSKDWKDKYYKGQLKRGIIKEEFEDTKGLIGIHQSKDRQHSDQKKKDKKRQTMIYKSLPRKQKI